jgi:hypothetical protein
MLLCKKLRQCESVSFIEESHVPLIKEVIEATNGSVTIPTKEPMKVATNEAMLLVKKPTK